MAWSAPGRIVPPGGASALSGCICPSGIGSICPSGIGSSSGRGAVASGVGSLSQTVHSGARSCGPSLRKKSCCAQPSQFLLGTSVRRLSLSCYNSNKQSPVRCLVRVCCVDGSADPPSSTATASVAESESLLDSSTKPDERMEEQAIDMAKQIQMLWACKLKLILLYLTREGTRCTLALRDENMEMKENVKTIPKIVPPPGDGQRIYEVDPYLRNYRDHLEYRYSQYKKKVDLINKYEGGLEAFSRGYEKFGFNRSATGITYREWAPGAKSASLMGDFNNWNPNANVMTKQNEYGVWETFLPNNPDGSPAIPHGSRVKIHMDTPLGRKDAIPAWIKFAVQAPGEIPYNGIYYDPPPEEKYEFKYSRPNRPKSLRIYEAHVGMSSTEPKVNSYAAFRDDVLPRIKRLGYNAVQLMAVMEHAYYGSFGYHVTNFFAVSSRCGTPDDLKSLIDKAHELGLFVLMDVVHSHASNNVLDGLNMFDGTDSHYFHSGARGYHWMWDSRLFDYSSWEVTRFLLSNLRWWMEEYQFDGFRFDGITSMMYIHHGLQMTFTGQYSEYFGMSTDVDAVVFLMLANDMLQALYPHIITVAEDVSGMPTLCLPVCDGGVGFDYRLQMAIADKWIELLSKMQDEEWDMGNIVFTLRNRRWMEKCIAYAESHDQALVGDKTLAFWLMDKDMYDYMAIDGPSTPRIDRGVALHKMIRLITMALGGEGYLNFMGNEFGHPEWIDFPRSDQKLPNGKFVPGNGNSFDKCRRRFDLADAGYLRYNGLQEFDRAMQELEGKYEFMIAPHEYVSRKDETDKMIVFEKGDLVFVFNFHWEKSYTDYRVGCLKPGRYKVLLDSDERVFGGFGRIDHSADFFTNEGWYDDRPQSFRVYAPCRTAVVYGLASGDPLAEFSAEIPDSIPVHNL